MMIKEGDKLPDAKIFVMENDPKEVLIKDIIGNDKTIIFGLPGAFTPTCSAKHLPGFVSMFNQLKEKGIKKVICIAINDPFVMDAWGKAHNVENKVIMLADSSGEFTKNIGAEKNLSHRGLGIRSSRYTMLIENGKIARISEEEAPGKCEITSAETFLKKIS